MVRHNFFLPENLVERMKRYSELSGVSLSEIVRRAIFAWLKEHERV